MADSLLQNDLTVFRYYFQEALDFYGISALYYQLKEGHHFTVAGELSAHYYDPKPIKLLFDQAPKISTLKKLGWVTELDQASSLVHVAFDLPGLSVGAVIEIKDPLTPDKGRLFRVTKMQTSILYPASVACQIVPVLGTLPEETVQPFEGKQSVFFDRKTLPDIEEF